MTKYIDKDMASEVVKSNRFDFLAQIEDDIIPSIVKDIRDSIMTNNDLNKMRDLTVDEIREKEMDNLIDCSIIYFSDTAYYGKVTYKGVEIQISELLALRTFDLSEIWNEMWWYDKPINGGWVRELVYKFTDKVDGQSNNG